jgi:hypothetical protein
LSSKQNWGAISPTAKSFSKTEKKRKKESIISVYENSKSVSLSTSFAKPQKENKTMELLSRLLHSS